jgi:hypothetical protein
LREEKALGSLPVHRTDLISASPSFVLLLRSG